MKPQRLNILLLGVFIVLMASAMVAFTANAIKKESERITVSMKEQAQVLANNLAATGADHLLARDYTAIELMLLRSAGFAGILQLQMSDDKGRLIADIIRIPGAAPQARYGEQPLRIPERKKSSIQLTDDRLIILQPVVK